MNKKQLTEEEIIIEELETLINSLKGDWGVLTGKIEKSYLDKKWGKIGRIHYCIDLDIIPKERASLKKEIGDNE